MQRPSMIGKAAARINRAKLKRIRAGMGDFAWLLSRRPVQAVELSRVTSRVRRADDGLIDRVMNAYTRAVGNYHKSEAMWGTHLHDMKSSVHDALVSGDHERAAAVLRNPAGNAHFWGFDSIAKAPDGLLESREQVVSYLNKRLPAMTMTAMWAYDALLNLADALGTRKVNYPEAPAQDNVPAENIDNILDSIDDKIGCALVFPNPYPGEEGLGSSRGIISFRAIQSLYQAWRIRQLTDGKLNPRILEVGAGLGRTAAFCWQLGLRNYSIIDIPLTNAAQGYFLGTVLEASNVRLHGESVRDGIHIMAVNELDSIEGKFDVVVNVDSLTEMDIDTANKYFSFAQAKADVLLSINHEFNEFTVHSLYGPDQGIRAVRYPYWMRRGYVEEVLYFK